jgi:hypothetical protein
MKKIILISSSIVISLVLVVAAGGAVEAFDQETVYLPVTFGTYCSDFFDDFSDHESGWYVGEDKYAKWEYLEGEYRILSKDDGYFYWSDPPTCSRENYTVEVDARWAGEPGNSYGILLGNNLEFDRLYSFEVNTDFLDFSLFYWDGSSWQTIVPWTVSPYINPGMASNHLKFTRNGTQITLEVNGNVLGTWADGNLSGPTYAAIMSDPYVDYPTSDARFDNFSVKGISSP